MRLDFTVVAPGLFTGLTSRPKTCASQFISVVAHRIPEVALFIDRAPHHNTPRAVELHHPLPPCTRAFLCASVHTYVHVCACRHQMQAMVSRHGQTAPIPAACSATAPACVCACGLACVCVGMPTRCAVWRCVVRCDTTRCRAMSCRAVPRSAVPYVCACVCLLARVHVRVRTYMHMHMLVGACSARLKGRGEK